eukprot:GHVS01068802.1.p1 GENE.GHVS01068802.1~~GHVS01068802.1.p1  ORF type:complete len:1214 (+),score=148.51 GHVS01068802.1:68-3643(+)
MSTGGLAGSPPVPNFTSVAGADTVPVASDYCLPYLPPFMTTTSTRRSSSIVSIASGPGSSSLDYAQFSIADTPELSTPPSPPISPFLPPLRKLFASDFTLCARAPNLSEDDIALYVTELHSAERYHRAAEAGRRGSRLTRGKTEGLTEAGLVASSPSEEVAPLTGALEKSLLSQLCPIPSDPTEVVVADFSDLGVTDDGLSILIPCLLRASLLRVLSISNNLLSDVSVGILAECLFCLPHLRLLDLSNNRLGRQGAVAVSRSFWGGAKEGGGWREVDGVMYGEVWELDLSDNPIGDAGVIAIAQHLSAHPVPCRLSLRCCGMSAPSVCSLASCSRCFLSLDISDNPLLPRFLDFQKGVEEQSGWGNRGRTVPSSKRALFWKFPGSQNALSSSTPSRSSGGVHETVSLRGMEFAEYTVVSPMSSVDHSVPQSSPFIHPLPQYTEPQSLSPSSFPHVSRSSTLGAASATEDVLPSPADRMFELVAAIARFISDGPNLRALHLDRLFVSTPTSHRWNGIPRAGHSLSEVCSSRPTISPTLPCIGEGDRRLSAWQLLTKSNSTLSSFSLASALLDLQNESVYFMVDAITKALPRNSSLLTLSFAGNGVTDKLLAHLCQNLSQSAIEDLDLSDNFIADLKPLASCLGENSSLRMLDLSRNKIDDQACLVLAGAMTNRLSLSELNLSGNSLGDVGLEALAEAVKSMLEIRRASNRAAETEGGGAATESTVANFGSTASASLSGSTTTATSPLFARLVSQVNCPPEGKTPTARSGWQSPVWREISPFTDASFLPHRPPRGESSQRRFFRRRRKLALMFARTTDRQLGNCGEASWWAEEQEVECKNPFLRYLTGVGLVRFGGKDKMARCGNWRLLYRQTEDVTKHECSRRAQSMTTEGETEDEVWMDILMEESCEVLSPKVGLRLLDISHTKVTDFGGQSLSSVLGRLNCPLEYVDITGCSIQTAGLELLRAAASMRNFRIEALRGQRGMSGVVVSTSGYSTLAGARITGGCSDGDTTGSVVKRFPLVCCVVKGLPPTAIRLDTADSDSDIEPLELACGNDVAERLRRGDLRAVGNVQVVDENGPGWTREPIGRGIERRVEVEKEEDDDFIKVDAAVIPTGNCSDPSWWYTSQDGDADGFYAFLDGTPPVNPFPSVTESTGGDYTPADPSPPIGCSLPGCRTQSTCLSLDRQPSTSKES